MSFMKDLAILSTEGRKQGYTHYEYGVATRENGEVHLVLGVLKDNTAVEILGMDNEARAKAVVNLLNSDIGGQTTQQNNIGDMPDA